MAFTFVLAACGGDDGDGNIPVVPAPAPTPAPPPAPSPSPTPTPAPTVVRIDSDFGRTIDGWTADHADYGPGSASPMFEAGYARLPDPLQNRFGYRLYGFNSSDDLFMYIHRRVDGLRPNTRYRIEGSVEFAAIGRTDEAGIGSSLFLKFGASSHDPRPALQNGYYRVGFDKGDQWNGGRDAALLGLYGIPCRSCSDRGVWAIARLDTSTAEPSVPVVTSDQEGRLWLVVGADSGFEIGATLYFTAANFILTPQ